MKKMENVRSVLALCLLVSGLPLQSSCAALPRSPFSPLGRNEMAAGAAAVVAAEAAG